MTSITIQITACLQSRIDCTLLVDNIGLNARRLQMPKKINRANLGNIKISHYALRKEEDGTITQIDWQEGASTLTQFAIAKYTGTLLTGKTAVVALIYKNGNVYEIYGNQDDVQTHAIDKILGKKRLADAEKMILKFQEQWNSSKPYTPSSLQSKIINDKQDVIPNSFLKTALANKKTSIQKLAETTGQTRQSIYNQIAGERGVTRENAIKYGKELGVDPVDLLFPKQTTEVWGYVNTVQSIEADEVYSPCRIFPQFEPKTVVVPRDIYTPNIKAIKIDARGSMYDKQIAFYYKDNAEHLDINNKLCIVGTKVKGFMDEEFDYYYFGLYENIRGKNNLINPDPYAEGVDKYILQNFNLTFISPIITMIDPKAVRDATTAAHLVPQEMLYTEAELQKQVLKLQEEHQQIVNKLRKENEEDLQKGKRILEDYNKAQKDLELKIQQVSEEIRKSYYKADEVKASKLFRETGSVSDFLFKKDEKKSA